MHIGHDKLLSILSGQPVIPVITIHDLDMAVPLARALVAGGLPAIEITLRTEEGLKAISLINDEVEGAIVGAGSVLGSKQFKQVENAGGQFIVSPGTTQELLDIADQSSTPFLPGVATASEAMALREEGFLMLKFFPAEQAGGAAYLQALSAPLSDIKFCPTGGINPGNALEYLELDNVLAVGGSWVAPNSKIEAGDWTSIQAMAAAASGLAKKRMAS